MNYKLYQLSGNVLNTYRAKVKGNEFASAALVRRKLTRNIMLAAKVPYKDGEGAELYMYGNLHIWVKGNKIIEIRNMKGKQFSRWFFKDQKRYEELNEMLEINKYELISLAKQHGAKVEQVQKDKGGIYLIGPYGTEKDLFNFMTQ
ncbi:hypothetical protein [Paenibacillus medicaginis]|uniref:Bro-N domain-containing protein n=1 Tax=Paenibacillus medicaginis TaxID=1470560 RepID=A0ABV5BUL0_9BACL